MAAMIHSARHKPPHVNGAPLATPFLVPDTAMASVCIVVLQPKVAVVVSNKDDQGAPHGSREESWNDGHLQYTSCRS